MIYSIKDKNGTLQNSTENIIKAAHEFCSNLFKEGVTENSYRMTFSGTHKKTITMEQQSLCDKELNITDLKQGMEQLPSGELPGTDGLPVEFCQTMAPNQV